MASDLLREMQAPGRQQTRAALHQARSPPSILGQKQKTVCNGAIVSKFEGILFFADANWQDFDIW
jgi:hypothetical protein